MALRTAVVLFALLVAGPVPSWGQALPHLFINDSDVTLQTAPLVEDGVLLLPAEVIGRAFGAAVDWDAKAKAVVLTGASGRRVRLAALDTRVQIDGTPYPLPIAPMVRPDNKLWAPALAVLRALGADIVEGDDGRTETALAQVTDVSWHIDGAGLAVRIAATGPVRVDTRALHAPERLVVDLGGAVPRLASAQQDIGLAGVVRMRAGQFQVRPFITRVVFDLERPMKFSVDPRLGEVAVALGDASLPAAHTVPAPVAPTPVTPQAVAPPSATPRPNAVPPAPSPSTSPPSVPPVAAIGSAGPADRRTPAAGAAPPGTPGPADRRTAAQAAAPPGISGPGDRRAADATAPEPLAAPPLPDFSDKPGAFHVQAVAYDDQDHSGRITIRASQHVAYAVREFVYPERLAIDITGGVYLPRRQDIEVDSDAVRNIVISQLQLKPNVARILVHLNRKLPYTAVATDGGRTLLVTLGDPGQRLARGSAVIIDPGHGGSDGGALGPTGLREADVALAISRLVHDDLSVQGIPSVLTRTDDSTVALEDRPDLAVRNGGIVFVSIHANGSRSIGSAGTETYYKTPVSQALATVVQAEMTQALGEPDRGVHTADFYVLVNTPMPAVLVETAFITNPSEEALLRDPGARQRIADAIVRAIAKYLAAERQPGSLAPDAPAVSPRRADSRMAPAAGAQTAGH